ncbi:glutathione S-transferase family protein [Phenylobacterium sp.]|uniref:glutathione S-transferase family protein n=1 Tax=Phenylobacterium sp. TaxID=1871053 RepID=UPI002FCC816B
MADIVLHTDVLSPYGWAARLVAAEKGVSWRLKPVNVALPAHWKLHPFGKMPVLEHRGVIVYETLAIVHYIDRAFSGPALQPSGALAQAEMLQWISVVNGYMFPVMNGLLKERTSAMWRAEGPDDEVLASFKGPLELQVQYIDRAVAEHDFLVDGEISLADSFLLPHLHFVSATPEGAQALERAPAAQAWLDRMRERPSFAATTPFGA